MAMFDRPIPGQSLTEAPRNAPYERPPEVTDPEQAVQIHLERLTRPEVMEDALFFLEMGVDLVSLVEGILRSAVMQGIHSLDVSLIIAPVLHEYIKSAADTLEVEYDEGFEDKKGAERKSYSRDAVLAQRKMEKLGIKPKDLSKKKDMPAPEAVPVVEEEMPVMAEEKPAGLMARRA